MQNRRKWLASGFAILVAGTLVAGCGATKPANATTNQTAAQPQASLPKEPTYSGPVVATYQGGQLTKAELDHEYNLQVVLVGAEQKETKKAFLTNYVVLYKYLYGQALKQPSLAPVTATQAGQLADQALQQLAQNPYKSKAEVDAKMKALGLAKDDLILWAEREQFLQEYLQTQVQVPDSQLQQYYDQHKTDYMQVTVDQVLVATEAKAKQIEAELKGGANFAQVADKNSTDPSVKQNHGQFKDAMVGQFVAEFAQACKTLPIGQISDPVHTQYGYHILKVESRTQLPFAQVKDQIKQQLLPQVQSTQLNALYAKAVTDAKVKTTVKDADL
ncbi:MAG: hypothetical protein A2201_13565 [Alicyclobacillus sp. RIFOXYA1_FULL_53_8]|nr:MAG: hypothetical protein A2201_13565 [Alicyclobacillus sp. RIFOXYA1_FULL_53_8]